MTLICTICANDAFQRLPDPLLDRSITSDLRVVGEPLDKYQCRVCGAIRRGSLQVQSLFDDAYDLYAHDPGWEEEARRQRDYAAWLARALERPASCFEAGSGNGSLLLALRAHWGDAALAGVEPAEGAAAAARRAGLDVATGFLQPAISATKRAALAFAVNVIEHTQDPCAFLRALASHGERVAIICPDATAPNNEVLFHDHLHSWRPDHLRTLFARADLRVDLIESAPESLGCFQLVAGRPTNGAVAPAPYREPDAAHARYLEAWRSLDRVLLERVGSDEAVAFGAGEAAGLLRAYAPGAWARVKRCAVDAPQFEYFGRLRVVDALELEPATLVLAVRPAVQAALDVRLRERGHRVIRWDDLIER